ncbi:hypothetical protein ACFFW8_14130 [Erwinia tracheiphila]|uniref:Uncharacterized protein n=1 Tax=Erwinia tracheiphila TaxID=65700 RepID=A0A345CSR2_9GAMM|nr:hypothetical protein AV903_11220 [Erwinia tracheiphila]
MSVPSRCCSASHSCLISTSLMRCRLWHKKIWLGVTELLFSVVIFSNSWPVRIKKHPVSAVLTGRLDSLIKSN